MQLKHYKTLAVATSSSKDDFSGRINATCFSPNGLKLAVASKDNVIYLYDETGERKDKFPTKASSDAKSSYSISGLAFSADAAKLALAQSDGGVFVYKIGAEWGEKKSICNKFIETSDITCLIWPRLPSSSIIYGTADGKVYLGNLKSNKSSVIFDTGVMTVSLVSNPEGNAFVSGHADGSINRYSFAPNTPDSLQGRFAIHSCSPEVLVWGTNIMAAGNDMHVIFYDNNGVKMHDFNYFRDETQHEFTAAQCSAAGESIIVSSFDRLHMFKFNVSSLHWKEADVKQVQGLYSPSTLAWNPNGATLAIGSISGNVELFECFAKKTRFNGKYDILQVSANQVSVSKVASNFSTSIKSESGFEITTVKVLQDRYIVAFTGNSLIICDMQTQKRSEVPWMSNSSNAKFMFSYPGMCIVQNLNEVTIVALGQNSVIGSIRTESLNKNLLSLLLRDGASSYAAYLMDARTINVTDLTSGQLICEVAVDTPVEYIQISRKAEYVLFRDRLRKLSMYDITKKQTFGLCTDATFCQGDVVSVEKDGVKNRVAIDDGTFINLEDSRVEYSSAIEDQDFGRAVMILESLETTPETLGLWKSLAERSLKEGQIYIAERCFAAHGDISTVRYLRQVLDLAEQLKRDNPLIEDVMSHFLIKSKLFLLENQYKMAEITLLEQGRVQEAMDMYQEMHKWEDSIKVAQVRNHPDLETLKVNYFNWLVESAQYEQAAEIKEQEGDLGYAINLFLQGGMASKASKLLQRHSKSNSNPELLERVSTALIEAGLYEKAGDLLKQMNRIQDAYEAYKQGKEYRSAIDLARQYYPQDVIMLEELWAETLLTRRQTEAAINHFLEAGKLDRAMEVAATSKQWKKLADIMESIPMSPKLKPYFLVLGAHYESMNDYDRAEEQYKKGGDPEKAVEMYIGCGKWHKAYSMAKLSMSTDDADDIFLKHAKTLESKHLLREAEQIYVLIGDADEAINMYKDRKQYDQMIRLVKVHHRDLLQQTLVFLGDQTEKEGNYHEAEQFYLDAGEWKSVVSMYCAQAMFEDALRVPLPPCFNHAYKSLGGDAAYKLLEKHGVFLEALDIAFENNHYEFALDISSYASKEHQLQVFKKYGAHLEADGKLKEAEEQYLKANMPKEAIVMYIRSEDWSSALSVAEKHTPAAVNDVLIAKGKVCFGNNEFGTAETCLLRAQRPNIMIDLYRDAHMWSEALKFAAEHLPTRVPELQRLAETLPSSAKSAYQPGPGGVANDVLGSARMFEQKQEYDRAIDTYLKLTSKQIGNVKELEGIWGRAIEIALKFVPGRAEDVTRQVADRFLQLQQYGTAANLYASVNNIQKAAEIYIAGGMWEEAKRIAERQSQVLTFVESAYVQHLKSIGKVEALADVDLVGALDIYVKNGDWDKCIEKAHQSGIPEVMNKYLAVFCDQMVLGGMYDRIIGVLTKYGPLKFARDGFYQNLSFAIIEQGDSKQLVALRDILGKIGSGNASIERCCEAVTLIILHKQTAAIPSLATIAAKQSISLLRYADNLPADRLFYEAGATSKRTSNDAMTFLLWNFYLDLADAIEDKLKQFTIQDGEFVESDVPKTLKLSLTNITDDKREEVRDYVLGKSLELRVDKASTTRICQNCSSEMLISSLTCCKCNKTERACIVTGYPLEKDPAQCGSCKKLANKEDWNSYLIAEKKCPNCASLQTPSFNLKQ